MSKNKFKIQFEWILFVAPNEESGCKNMHNSMLHNDLNFVSQQQFRAYKTNAHTD